MSRWTFERNGRSVIGFLFDKKRATIGLGRKERGLKQSKPSHDIRHTEPNPDGNRFIVENAPEILALIGGAGVILYVSPYTEKVLVTA